MELADAGPAGALPVSQRVADISAPEIEEFKIWRECSGFSILRGCAARAALRKALLQANVDMVVAVEATTTNSSSHWSLRTGDLVLCRSIF